MKKILRVTAPDIRIHIVASFNPNIEYNRIPGFPAFPDPHIEFFMSQEEWRDFENFLAKNFKQPWYALSFSTELVK